jgi:hypothetical protein
MRQKANEARHVAKALQRQLDHIDAHPELFSGLLIRQI